MATDTIRITDQELSELLRDPVYRRGYREGLWYQGDLSADLRPHGQTSLWEFVNSEYAKSPGPAPFVLETHRRLGKSNLGLRFCVQRAIREPGQRIIYTAPTAEQALPIVRPNLAVVIQGKPVDLKIEVKGKAIKVQNPLWPRDSEPSVIEIYGINKDPDAARGAHCDVAVVDEAGFINKLEYFVNDVLSWQFSRRKEPLFLMLSTPPPSMDHPFITKYVPEAMSRRRHMVIPASKNADFTREDEELVLQIVGAKGTIAWRREAECEHISDPDSMVIPEWIGVRSKCIRAWDRPAYYFPLLSVDLGWQDYTHALYGYIDFENRKLVIDDEVWMHKTSLGPLVEALVAKEEVVFDDQTTALKDDTRWIADADPLVIDSLNSEHHLHVQAAVRHNFDERIARLRTLVTKGGLIVHPRCEHLIYQLDNAVWKDPDKERKDFIRSEALGHCDGIAALSYMNRQAKWTRNPEPMEFITNGRGRNIVGRREFYRRQRGKRVGHAKIRMGG